MRLQPFVPCGGMHCRATMDAAMPKQAPHPPTPQTDDEELGVNTILSPEALAATKAEKEEEEKPTKRQRKQRG